jgi:hypothetical protein
LHPVRRSRDEAGEQCRRREVGEVEALDIYNQAKSCENSAGFAYHLEFNGQTLYDVNTFALTLPDKNIRTFEDRASTGFIGLQRHAGDVVQADACASYHDIYLNRLDR